MDRKDFLVLGCKTCLLGAAILTLPGLESCSPASYGLFKTTVTDNKISLPLSVFEKNSLQIVRPQGWQYDIAVQKNSAGTYAALLLQCTHMDNQLNTSSSGYTCSLHGSRFDKEGKVVKGPAERPLKKYKTDISNNNLVILI